MTSLRRQMIEDMQIRNLAANTRGLMSDKSPDSRGTSKSRQNCWDLSRFGPTRST